MSRARLRVVAGDTLTRVIDWDDSDGDPIDLTGAVVTATLTVGDTTYNLAEGSGLTVDDDDGQITLVLSAVQTAAIESRYGTWHLKVAQGSVVTTLAKGLVFVSL